MDKTKEQQIIDLQDVLILNMRQAIIAMHDAFSAAGSQDRLHHLTNANRFFIKVEELDDVLKKLRKND